MRSSDISLSGPIPMIIPRLAQWLRPHLLLSCLLGLGATGWAVAEETPAQAMAHAIARMMESMGFNGAASGARSPGYPAPPSVDGWPSAFGSWPMSGNPAQGAAANMTQMAGRAYQGMMPSEQPAGSNWTPGPLEGVWEDNQGGLLIVQGALYRIYAVCNAHIDGDIRVLDGRVELTNRQQNFTQTFEYALDQGRLALRDPSGQVFLYRRLLLGH